MLEQNAENTFNMAFGFPQKYRDDATFVQKIFSHIDRRSRDELRRRINAEASKGTKRGWGWFFCPPSKPKIGAASRMMSSVALP